MTNSTRTSDGRNVRLAATATLCLLAAAPGRAAEPAVDRAPTGGNTSLSLRLRFENMADDAFARDGNAPTFRLRLGYETLRWRQLSALVEVDHLGLWGADAYNSTRNGRTDRPQVSDPEATDLNQLALKIGIGRNEWVLGRQRLALDNQRFIGSSAWRQNEQTYDAATWRTKLVPRVALSYSFIANANRVVGPDAGTPPPDLRLRGHVLEGSIDLHGAGRLATFAHWLDVRNAAALSHRNLGMLWTGEAALGPRWKLPWTASFVRQQGHGNNPTRYAADYLQFELGVARGDLGLRAGVEILGGDATRAGHMLQTPFASLHTFQGWADKFTTTPTQGLRDRYAVASARRWGWSAQLSWHSFGAEAISRDYGSEWDLSLTRKIGKRGELLLKAADYRAASFQRDTRKLWLQTSFDVL